MLFSNGKSLGLAIVKNLIDLMQGTVNIESQPGLGTKVTICTPHRLGSLPEPKNTDESDRIDYGILAGRHILLAEDIDINAVLLITKILTEKS